MIKSTLQRLPCFGRRPILSSRNILSRSLCQTSKFKFDGFTSMQLSRKYSCKALDKLTYTQALRPKLMSTMAASARNTVSSSSSNTTTKTMVTHTKPIVAYWLYFNAGMVFAIVVVGGLTRLTESGLSIVEWNVISGMKPPRSEQEWKDEFEKYKQYPEYKL